MGSKEPELVNTLEDGVRILRFNRPARKNALSATLMKSFREALIEAASDANTIITVITGTGDYFSSGNDLGNFLEDKGANQGANDIMKAETEEEKYKVTRKGVERFEEIMATIIEFPKPLIAVVNGPAVGMAVTMLPHLDIVYASERATFLTPFVTLAQSPEGCSTFLFPRIMGHGKAAEMLLFSKKITAADAYQHGLVTEVFPDHCLHEVWPRIREWGKLPPNSLFNARRLIKEHLKDHLLKVNTHECDQLAHVLLHEEFLEALMKFFNRKSKL